MVKPTALLFHTHFFDRGAARLFERLRRQCPPHSECFVLMHVPPGTPKPPRLAAVPHHLVTSPDIRALDHPRKNAARDWTGRSWECWGGGHCDLVAMHFFNAYPDYARYWVVEYDVCFTGNWRTLFDAFEDSPSDFLSTSVRRRRDSPVWVNWDAVQGPAPEEESDRHRVGTFTPPYRASRRTMETMDAAYRAGWGGHLEASWATILDFHGCSLEDMGGDGEFVRPGNRDRFYTAAKPNARCDLLAPGTVMAKSLMHRAGNSPNRLYHPVRTSKFWPEFKLVLWEARVWQGAGLAGRAAAGADRLASRQRPRRPSGHSALANVDRQSGQRFGGISPLRPREGPHGGNARQPPSKPTQHPKPGTPHRKPQLLARHRPALGEPSPVNLGPERPTATQGGGLNG